MKRTSYPELKILGKNRVLYAADLTNATVEGLMSWIASSGSGAIGVYHLTNDLLANDRGWDQRLDRIALYLMQAFDNDLVHLYCAKGNCVRGTRSYSIAYLVTVR